MSLLSSEPMRKVRIICLTQDKKPVIAGLHGLGVIDLRKSALQIA